MRFFGPVLFYDLVRSARRARVFVNRAGYLLLLLVVLWMMHAGVRPDYRTGTASPDQAARMAESFFATFLAVQFGLAVMLTPAYTAGAIAEEKERRTLEFLLA